MNAWPKVCGCGLAHAAEEWQTLKLVGYHDDDIVEPGHPVATTLEIRNCHCGSTISIELPRRPRLSSRIIELAAGETLVKRALSGE